MGTETVISLFLDQTSGKKDTPSFMSQPINKAAVAPTSNSFLIVGGYGYLDMVYEFDPDGWTWMTRNERLAMGRQLRHSIFMVEVDREIFCTRVNQKESDQNITNHLYFLKINIISLIFRQ